MANVSSNNSLGERVPKLRFPGFEGEWEKCKVAQIFRRIQMPVDVEATKSYIQVGIRSHGKGLFYKEPVLGEELGNKRVFWIEPNCFIVNIVFAWERAVAKTTISENGLIASHRFPMYKPISEIVDLDYVTIYFITKYGQKILELASPGGAGRNKTLGQNEFLNSFIVIPKIKEQKKIAEFIQLINKKIKIQQSLVESLKLYKRGLLSKLFSQKGESVPQYRFAGFTDAWEQRKLGELADIIGGGTPSTNNNSFWDGDIDWYAPAEIGTKIYLDSSERKITEEGFNNSSAKMLPVGTVLFTSRAGIGKTAILAKEGCTNQGFQSIVPHEKELDSYFIFSRTEELKKYGEVTGAGSTFVEVSGKQMANMDIIMPPTIDEQRQIGGCFKKIDNLITLHQRKQDFCEKVKVALLQQMFI